MKASALSVAQQSRKFVSSSRIAADIDLDAEGKATGFVRVPHSVHRSAYGWIPIPIVRIKNGEGPDVLMQGGNHGRRMGRADCARQPDPQHRSP